MTKPIGEGWVEAFNRQDKSKMLDRAGRLDRAVPVRSHLDRPKSADLEDGAIHWTWHRSWEDEGDSDEDIRERFNRSGTELLDAFLDLADGDRPDEQVRAFASQWGPLGLCHHGLPPRHAYEEADPQTLPMPVPPDYCTPRPGRVELLEDWRRWALIIRSAIRIAARAFQVEFIPDELFTTDIAVWAGTEMDGSFVARTAAGALGFVCGRLNDLAELAGLRPRLEIDGGGVKITLLAETLLAGIVMEAITVVARKDLSWCSGCGEIYERSRRPAPGRRNFCPECKAKKVPLKLAQQDHRSGASTPRGTKSRRKQPSREPLRTVANARLSRMKADRSTKAATTDLDPLGDSDATG